ncbi:hypothetical protein [Orenia marismortui]|uniref:hypothetical protein n=1 Tax=Orenia marismortui TaxID=46469 RepID=UPI0003640AB7|nr:hypothetical protein [Orenia marismortui]
MNRRLRSQKRSQDLSDKIFATGINNIYWQGRADILLEVVDKGNGEIEEIMIGEVKYTDKVDTAKKGLGELFNSYVYRKYGYDVEFKWPPVMGGFFIVKIYRAE